jgi:hypothetical protein
MFSDQRRSRRDSALGALWIVFALMVWMAVSSLASATPDPKAGQDAAVLAAKRPSKLADLQVPSATVELAAGSLLGSATVENLGAARARSSTAGVAWKSAGSGGLIQLGKFTVPALRPGQRHKAHFHIPVPKDALAGVYTVSVCADVLGQVQKRSKKSSCRDAGVITIRGSGVKAPGPEPSPPPPATPTTPGGSPTPPASSPPDTVIDSGPSGLMGVSSVTFTFHGSDTNDTFQCSLDGAPWASCTSPQGYTALAEGAHSFQVRAVNAAGEVDPTPASASFTVEATPPQTTITTAPSGRIPIGEVSISFTSTEAGSSFRCSLDGASYSPCSSPDVIKDPAAGPHTFKVQATNQAEVKETAGPPSASWSSVEPQHDLCGTISSNTTIGPDYAARYVITCSVTVASGATLTAQPGTIIKAEQGTRVSAEGSLDAVGTASEPVTFTSINDNSVGGTTGSGTPAPGDWEGIGSSGGGSIDLEHARVSYARTGVFARGEGATVIKDDVFVSQEDGAAFVDNHGAGAPSPMLEDDSSAGSGNGAAFVVRSLSLNADLLGGNSATGDGSQVVALEGTIAATSTLPAEGAAWEVDPDELGQEVLTVPVGKTLTIAPGAVIKGPQFGESCGCAISVEGSLDAVGTASEPVTFTSINDNSVGGTTGSGTPAPGDWEGIHVADGGSAQLEHTTLEYAATALSVAEEAEVTIRGAILHSTVGVSSHAYVEATGVNWGSPSGPAPFGTGTPIEGEVLAKPWVGYVAPSIPPEPPYEAPSEKFANCGDYFVIGARGSGEDPQGNPPVYSSNEDGFGSRDYNAYYGLKKVIEAYGVPESDFNVLGLRYRALGVEAAALVNGEYEESIWEGVAALKEVLHERETECPSEPAILIGYSQGALVIHLALRELQKSDPSMLSASHIAGVMLIADPAKVGSESEPVWEEENVPAAPGSGIYKADGLWTKLGEPDSGPLPSAVTNRAISFCANHDIVCAPGFGSHLSEHENYYQAGNLNAMGEWMAERILGRN